MSPRNEDVEAATKKANDAGTFKCQTTAITTDESFFMNGEGRDLVWGNVNMKLLEKAGETDVKLNILKVRPCSC